MVPFNQVLKFVARFDSQCLANLSWNGCLSLTCYSGMLHRIVPCGLGIPYILIIPYFTSLGKRLLSIAGRWPYIQHCGLICDRFVTANPLIVRIGKETPMRPPRLTANSSWLLNTWTSRWSGSGPVYRFAACASSG